MDFKMHEFSHAVVAKVSCGTNHKMNDLRCQYDSYIRLLKELNLEIIEVDVASSSSDVVVLEDLAVVCHGIALLLKPKPGSPEEATKAIKNVLQNNLDQTIIQISDPDAKLLGSDVLFTGREFFVGICDTSNEAGASAVAEAFPEFPCTPIKVSKGYDHIKKYITVAGHDILCVGASKEAQEMLKRMEREATFCYQTLTVPEDEAANCLFVNETLIHRAIEEIPNSFK
ncbi:unnamed protein product, partial [Leptidea sinapis]